MNRTELAGNGDAKRGGRGPENFPGERDHLGQLERPLPVH